MNNTTISIMKETRVIKHDFLNLFDVAMPPNSLMSYKKLAGHILTKKSTFQRGETGGMMTVDAFKFVYFQKKRFFLL